MNTQIKFLFILLLLLKTSFLSGQEVKRITYGGNGNRSNGTVSVRYYIQSGDRQYSIDEINNKVDLNDYRNDIRFVIEMANLKLGLNNSFSKIRNSNHSRVYYLQASRLDIDITGIKNVGLDTIKISARGGHHGKTINQISYKIDETNTKKKLLFQVKTAVIDGVYGKKWKSITLSKAITVLPKIKNDKNSASKVIASDTIQNNISTIRTPNKKRANRWQGYPKTSKQKEEQKTIEDQFWAIIEQDLISNSKERVRERCKIYLTNCTMQIFKECKFREDALFYLANYSLTKERDQIVQNYKEQFPTGKYIEPIEKLIALPPDATIPIEKGLAKMDFDLNGLLIQRVKGGNRPYYIGFYDNEKSKEYAIKRIRFNKENMFVALKSLEIPEGTYEVKVIDSNGQVFIEKQKVYISQVFTLPKSIKVTALLLFLLVLGFLYKKYIHF